MNKTLTALIAFLVLLPAGVPAADLQYIRAAGVPQEMSLFFPGCDPQGTYTLTVKNGQDDAHRATSGSVIVKGIELVNAADFALSPPPAIITKMIGNVAERNTIALSHMVILQGTTWKRKPIGEGFDSLVARYPDYPWAKKAAQRVFTTGGGR